MKNLTLTKGRCTIVDDDTYEWAIKFKWSIQSTKSAQYAARRGNVRYGEDRSKIILLHRVVAGAKKGRICRPHKS
jgi:hypothetical protein